MHEKARENRLRRHLSKQGLALRKSRIRNTHFNNCGGYMIIDINGNYVVAGSRFELNLDEAEQFVSK